MSTGAVPMMGANDGTYFRCRYSDRGCSYRYRGCDARGECNDYQQSRRQFLEFDPGSIGEVSENNPMASEGKTIR